MAENLLRPAIAGRRLMPAPTEGAPVQPAFSDLGTPLHDVTFVVVDLETTGGSATSSAITEIGAVKVRGGEVIGEFQTLVNPGMPIPPMITVLTGITTAMVIQAPPITEVLPSFFEFAHDTVWVAHNAGFDVSFLRAAANGMDLAWPAPTVVDTVRLARRVVTRDEVPNHKLLTLAGLFGADTTPNHRALADARATVDVLHGVLARMAPLGVTHLEDLATASDPVPPARRRKAHLAQDLPTGAGVYTFRGPQRRVLYIGTATNLRRRVRSYFTAAEKRARIGEMVDLAESVDVIECATALEASVRELRLIAEHKPAYNRRSRSPERQPWLRLTDEAHPRLSIVRTVPSDAPAIGPFGSQAAARDAMEAVVAATGLRTCTARLPKAPAAGASACILAELGRCRAPCIDAEADYAPVVAAAARVLLGDVTPVVTASHRAIATLSAQHRYEEAAAHRDRLAAFLRGAARTQRLGPLWHADEVVAARRLPPGSPGVGTRWEIVVVRYGRLAATTVTKPGHDPAPAIAALLLSAEGVAKPDHAGGAASAEESDLIMNWLSSDGVRLVHWRGAPSGWSQPVGGAEAYLADLGAAAFRDARATEHHVLGPALSDPQSREGADSTAEVAAPESATAQSPAAG